MKNDRSPFRVAPEVSEELAAGIAAARKALSTARSIRNLEKRDRALLDVKRVINPLRKIAPHALMDFDAALSEVLLELFRGLIKEKNLNKASLIVVGIPRVETEDLARAELARAYMEDGVYWGASKTIMFVKSPDLKQELELELAQLERPEPKRVNTASPADTLEAGPDGYRVMVIDNYNRHDPEERFLVTGFKSAEEAAEYARRRVRAAIEGQRKPGISGVELRQAWESMGEECVAGGQFIGAKHFAQFAESPAAHSDRDYLSLQPDRAGKPSR